MLWMIAAIYNLMGQQLDTLQHGMNIVGKKKDSRKIIFACTRKRGTDTLVCKDKY